MQVETHAYGSYEEFWPYYVAMHSRRATRVIHLIGTLGGLAAATDGLVRRRSWKALGWFPTLGYSFAWPAHFLLEKNNPATFGHPAWSFRGDVEMIRKMLAGRDKELQATARGWLAANAPADPDGSARQPTDAGPRPALSLAP